MVSGWGDGERAWERLRGWHLHAAPTGQDAVDALADVAGLRRLLDRAELDAVRGARKHRRSWAEIAAQVGLSRQSAWEKWRELDGPAVASRVDYRLLDTPTDPSPWTTRPTT